MDLFSAGTMASIFSQYAGHFLGGAKMALILSLITVILSTIFGTIFALGKMSKIKPLKWLISIYIEIFRSTPLMVQVMVIYFGAAAFGIKINVPFMKDFNSFFWGLLVLVLNSSAYVAEIVRSGIGAVDSGQIEAARSLGMSHGLTLKMVVLPQALRNILPALMNEFVSIIKETSIVSLVLHQRVDVLREGRRFHILSDIGALCYRSYYLLYYGIPSVKTGCLHRKEAECKCHTLKQMKPSYRCAG